AALSPSRSRRAYPRRQHCLDHFSKWRAVALRQPPGQLKLPFEKQRLLIQDRLDVARTFDLALPAASHDQTHRLTRAKGNLHTLPDNGQIFQVLRNRICETVARQDGFGVGYYVG